MDKMNFSKTIGLMTIIILGLWLFTFGSALAEEQRMEKPHPTPYSMDFYGSLEGAVKGDEVAVYDSQGTLSGLFIVEKDGQYGFLHVYGDDKTTAVDEGAVKNEPLTFELNGVPLVPSSGEPIYWLGDGLKRRVDF